MRCYTAPAGPHTAHMCTLKVHPPPTPTHASQHRAHLDIGRDVQRHLSKEGEHEHAQPEDKEEEEKGARGASEACGRWAGQGWEGECDGVCVCVCV